MKTRITLVLVSLLFAAVPGWAGKYLPERPGEESVADELIVKFKSGAPAASILQSILPGVAIHKANLRNVQRVKLNGRPSEALLRKLAEHPQVEFVEPNRIRRITINAPDDSRYGTQWALTQIQALEAWRLLPNRYLTSATAGTVRIKVAVLDTGGDCTHPDFKNSGGTSVYSEQGGQLSGTLSAALVPSVLATACAWQDDHSHGTHVSGTVAAATNNIEGVSALGHPLELIIFKVMDANGWGEDFTIAEGIVAAADAGAKIISLSLGGGGYSQTMQDAVTYAWQRDALIVAAAGNANTNLPYFPAGSNHAFGIAATGVGGVRASFSNYGTAIDIAAPGVNVLSTYPSYPVRPGAGTMYAGLSGTSMATPHVSALGGLLAMTTPGISASAIAQRIQLSAVSTTSGWDQYLGYGNINAYNAIAGNLRSSASGGIVGQIVDADGLPVQSSVSAAGQTVVTDDSGLFRIAGVPTGTYVITAAPAGFSSFSYSVGVVAGADTTVTLYAGVPTGRFSGRVSNTAGPLAGAIVQALQNGIIVAEAVADNTGAYSMAVPAGTYNLRAGSLSHASTTVPSRTVETSGVHTVDIALARFGTITGTVRDISGVPIANADVAVDGPSRAGGMTDAQGRYSTIGVPAGVYQATARSASHPAKTISGITVANGATAIANFSLATASVSVTPTTGFLTAGQTLQFTATVTGSSNQAVTWSRSPALGTISVTGLYTAPAIIFATTPVTITATSVAFPGRSASVTINVTNLFRIVLYPTTIVAGGTSTLHSVILEQAAPAQGAVIALAISDPAAASIPASVTIPAGATSATFTIIGGPVSVTKSVVITGTYLGVQRTANLTVRPAISVALQTLTLHPTTIPSGATSGGTVTLSGAAPTGGIVVQLATTNPSVTSLPASVAVPAGSISVGFTVTAARVSQAATATISATLNGVSKTAALAIRAPALLGVALYPVTVTGGLATTVNTVRIDAPSPVPIVVTLTSSNTAATTVQPSVTIPAGSVSAVFTITTKPVSAPTAVTITATYAGISKTAILTVKP